MKDRRKHLSPFEPVDAQSFILDGYDIYGSSYNQVALPQNSAEKLARYVMAATLAYWQGYSSIDYVLKNHLSDWKAERQKLPVHFLLDEILEEATHIFSEVYERRLSLNGLPDRFGLFAAGAAMMRLESSFKAGKFLASHGLHFESYCIAKLILEQLAWAYSVFEIRDKRLYSISPRKSISRLRSLIPRCGSLYGHINERAHIETKVINKLVLFEEGQGHVVLADWYTSIDAAIILLQLADMYGTTMESIYKEYLEDFRFLTLEGKHSRPNQERASLLSIQTCLDKANKFRQTLK